MYTFSQTRSTKVRSVISSLRSGNWGINVTHSLVVVTQFVLPSYGVRVSCYPKKGIHNSLGNVSTALPKIFRITKLGHVTISLGGHETII